MTSTAIDSQSTHADLAAEGPPAATSFDPAAPAPSTEPPAGSKGLAMGELRTLIRLAAPLAASSAGTQLMGLVDTAVVGRLGAEALGAVGLANALFFGISVLGIGLMMGLDPLISQALGAGQTLHARRLLWQGMSLAGIAGLLLSVPLAFAAPLLAAIGIAPELAEPAGQYLFLRLFGLIPTLMFFGLRGYLQAVGNTRPMLVSVVVANVFNLVADVLLVFGGGVLPEWAGPLRLLPAMGVRGAAIATVLGSLLQAGILAVAIGRLKVEGTGRACRRPDAGLLKQAARVGTPIGLQMGAEVGIFALVGLLAGRLGAQELAAHQISLTLASMSFTVALGVGAAGGVRVGHAIGARDQARTRVAGLLSFLVAGGFMSLSALVFLFAPGSLARLLTDQSEVIAAAIPLLGVAALFQISDGLQAAGAGVLRGTGDTRFAFIANLVGYYVIGLPVALIFGLWLGYGVVGMWWGLCAGLGVVSAVLLARFLKLSSRLIEPL